MVHRPRSKWILSLSEGRDITSIRLGGTHVIVVNSPSIALEFLKKHDATFASRPNTMAGEYVSRNFLSIGLFPWGEQVRKMRRVVSSEILNPDMARRMSKVRDEEADHVLSYLRNVCEEKAVNVRRAVRYYYGCFVRRVLFGKRHFGDGGGDGGPGEEEVEHVEAVFKALSLLSAFRVADFVPWLRALDLDGHERAMKRAMTTINKHHDPIIDERIERRRGSVVSSREDALDVMISLADADGKPFLSSEEIKAQAAEILYATIDNASNIVEWMLAMMMSHPEEYAKVMEELDRVVGMNRAVHESDFPRLAYMRACTRETLRLHPSAPFNLPHVSTCDATVAGYFIPNGSHVLLSRVGLSRNPKVWDDPLRFDPDRHLIDGSGVGLDLVEPDLRFISFSTGRRGCIATQLGTQITYMLLARMLQSFEWSVSDELGMDLREEEGSGFMPNPLHACVTPRFNACN